MPSFKSIALLFAVCFVAPLFSQDIWYTHPDFERTLGEKSDKKTNERIIRITDEHIYTEGTRKKDRYLVKYNKSDLKMEWRREFKSELKKGSSEFDASDAFFLGENIHLIYEGYDSKEDKYLFIDKVVSPDGDELKMIVLYQHRQKDKEPPSSSFVFSEDRKHIVLRVVDENVPSYQELELRLTWFDPDFNQTGSHREYSVFKNGLSHFESHCVANSGSYYMVGSKKARAKDEKDLEEHILYAFEPDGSSTMAALGMEEYFFTEPGIGFNNKTGDLIVHGEYGTFKSKEVNGMALLILDPEKLTEKQRTLTVFDELTVQQMIGTKEAYRLFKKNDKVNFELTDVITDSKGGFYVVYEDHLTVYIRDNMGGVTVNRHFNNLFVVYYNAKGEEQFFDVIPKDQVDNQFHVNDDAGYSAILKNDKLYLYFTMNKTSAQRHYASSEIFSKYEKRNMGIAQIILTPEGKENTTALLSYDLSADFYYMQPRSIDNGFDPEEPIFIFNCNNYGTQSQLLKLEKNN